MSYKYYNDGSASQLEPPEEDIATRIMDTLKFYLPILNGFSGPTLDATILETLQALKNDSSPSEGIRLPASVLDSRETTNLVTPLPEPPDIKSSLQSLLHKLTPQGPVECPSAVSLLQGVKKAMSNASVARSHASSSSSLSDNDPGALSGVKSFMSGIGLDQKPGQTVATSAAWDVFESKPCHSRVPPRSPSQDLDENQAQEPKFVPIFGQQDSCCLHFDSDEPLDERSYQPAAQAPPEPFAQRKKIQTLWGIARINVFDDCSKTIEILGTSSIPPPVIPDDSTEGIFAIGPPRKYK